MQVRGHGDRNHGPAASQARHLERCRRGRPPRRIL
jgi:hypothetical protein